MKAAAALSSLVLFAASSLAVIVSFDELFDNKTESLDKVACSSGANGLLTKGFTTFGSLPKFPYIGGTTAVLGWNSDKCGTCWAVTSQGKTINIMAVDQVDSGITISRAAMDDLTGGKADDLGEISAEAMQVPASACGCKTAPAKPSVCTAPL